MTIELPPPQPLPDPQGNILNDQSLDWYQMRVEKSHPHPSKPNPGESPRTTTRRWLADQRALHSSRKVFTQATPSPICDNDDSSLAKLCLDTASKRVFTTPLGASDAQDGKSDIDPGTIANLAIKAGYISPNQGPACAQSIWQKFGWMFRNESDKWPPDDWSKVEINQQNIHPANIGSFLVLPDSCLSDPTTAFPAQETPPAPQSGGVTPTSPPPIETSSTPNADALGGSSNLATPESKPPTPKPPSEIKVDGKIVSTLCNGAGGMFVAVVVLYFLKLGVDSWIEDRIRKRVLVVYPKSPCSKPTSSGQKTTDSEAHLWTPSDDTPAKPAPKIVPTPKLTTLQTNQVEAGLLSQGVVLRFAGLTEQEASGVVSGQLHPRLTRLLGEYVRGGGQVNADVIAQMEITAGLPKDTLGVDISNNNTRVWVRTDSLSEPIGLTEDGAAKVRTDHRGQPKLVLPKETLQKASDYLRVVKTLVDPNTYQQIGTQDLVVPGKKVEFLHTKTGGDAIGEFAHQEMGFEGDNADFEPEEKDDDREGAGEPEWDVNVVGPMNGVIYTPPIDLPDDDEIIAEKQVPTRTTDSIFGNPMVYDEEEDGDEVNQ